MDRVKVIPSPGMYWSLLSRAGTVSKTLSRFDSKALFFYLSEPCTAPVSSLQAGKKRRTNNGNRIEDRIDEAAGKKRRAWPC